jgi:hypothetical protein
VIEKSSSRAVLPAPYVERLLGELVEIADTFVAVLESSATRNIDPNRGGGDIAFIGYPSWGWAPSTQELEATRMSLLARVRDFRPRFELLFPHPTPEFTKRHGESLDRLERWLVRDRGDHSVPATFRQRSISFGSPSRYCSQLALCFRAIRFGCGLLSTRTR